VDDQTTSGLPDDYYDYGAGSNYDDTPTPSERAGIEANRRFTDAIRWAQARDARSHTDEAGS